MNLTLQTLENFKNILIQIPFPETERELTYLEIINAAHIESISSKMLAFIFNTQASHGLGTLGIQALLNVAHQKRISFNYPETLRAKKVQEEVSRFYLNKNHEKQSKVDLIIELSDLIIIIENKVFHKYNNPFKDYERTARINFKSHNNFLFLAIGTKKNLNKIEPFKFISHFDFGNELKKLIEKSNLPKSNHLNHIKDYLAAMDTHNPISATNKLDHEVFNFCQENSDILDKLNQSKSSIPKIASEKIIEIYSFLNSAHINPDKAIDEQIEKEIYDKWINCGASIEISTKTIKLKNKNISINLYLSYYLKYTFIFFHAHYNRSMTSLEETVAQEIFESNHIKLIDRPNDYNGYFVYQKETKGLESEKIAKEIDKYLDLLHKI